MHNSIKKILEIATIYTVSWSTIFLATTSWTRTHRVGFKGENYLALVSIFACILLISIEILVGITKSIKRKKLHSPKNLLDVPIRTTATCAISWILTHPAYSGLPAR